SAVPGVRALLRDDQRRIIAASSRIVVEGRDIGTVVAPDADLKVYLTAAEGERARRRSAENSADLVETTADLARRDRLDSSRAANPLRATVVDTGGWEPDAKDRAAVIAAQAEIAVQTADVVLFVVDAIVGGTDVDEAAVRMLRRGGKPVLLVANKVDDQRTEVDASRLWSL